MKRIQTPMSKILSKKYIEFYCHAREKGLEAVEALLKAKYDLQGLVIDYMIQYPNDISIIGIAYENVKMDNTLPNKASIAYDLKSCSKEVREKYTPLLTF
jgi:hypothetical protein